MLDLIVAIALRRAADRDVLEITRRGIVAVPEAENRRFRTRDEHLFGPARAAQQRRRTHLAPHREGLAVGADDVEVQIRVRIDEVDALDDALDLDGLRAIEAAEAVMGERGRRGGERKDEARGGHQSSRRGGTNARTFVEYIDHVTLPPRRFVLASA